MEGGDKRLLGLNNHRYYFFSTGNPDPSHNAKPPTRALALLKPLFKRMRAARALLCSSVHVQ